VSGYGGTGKTFLWNAIISFLRAQRKIVLSVASSGVGSLLLARGQMAHSRFKFPCELDETTMCGIKKGTKLSELIQLSSLIIWDEALMTSRTALEALDRTLQDLLSTSESQNKNISFGGKTVVLGGDLRYILPIVEGGSRAEIVNVAIVNSHLLSSVTVLHLKKI
jgi:ATP-dependent DNA helicase PIF1